MAKMCTVSRLERQFATLYLFHAPTRIYLHRSGHLLENGLDRPENCYGRYAFACFSSISISTVGVDGARVFPSEDFLFLLSGWWW